MSELRCLRCKTVSLSEAGPSGPSIAFFECPRCRRQYALKADRQLTFRWPHPIGLALYLVQLDESPAGRASEVAVLLIRDRPAEQLEVFAREIRLELEEPTQPVRDILDCRATEGELREFLRLVAKGFEVFLAGWRSGSQDTA